MFALPTHHTPPPLLEDMTSWELYVGLQGRINRRSSENFSGSKQDDKNQLTDQKCQNKSVLITCPHSEDIS